MLRSRFTVRIAIVVAAASFAPFLLAGCDHPREFASDARADTLPAAALGQAQPTPLPGDRQLSGIPSLAPIVKQLRPTVVNVASRFKPRRIARNQRPPQGRQQRPPNP